MINLQQPYQPRPIRFLELWKVFGWRLKVYGIAYQRIKPRGELVDAARSIARQFLSPSSVLPENYGVGFLGVHDG